MRRDDTIAALATPPGQSPRALIRVSGPLAHRLPLLSAADATHLPDASHALSVARFTLSNTPVPLSLPVLCLRARGPRSFTGEDVLELLLPGNPHLVRRALDAILAVPGVRHATPGEFSARAFLSGRLTLDQAEGIAASIAAQTDDELTAAQDLRSGAFGTRIAAWADELATLLALVEAGIDFADQEDVIPIAPRHLAQRLDRLHAALTAHLHAPATGRPVDAIPRVVLVGRPSTGKSTLFNALLSRPRAIVAPEPGTTRDVLEEPLDCSAALPGAGVILLCDLPGLDLDPAPLSPSAAQAQHAARAAIAAADALIHCDPTGAFDLPGLPDRPTIRVRTKADLPAPTRQDPPDTLAVCALDGLRLPALIRAIADRAVGSRGSGVCALLPRYARALRVTADAIAAARDSIDPGSRALTDPALTAGSLRHALDAMGDAAGRMSPDDIIGRVFSTFCVGK